MAHIHKSNRMKENRKSFVLIASQRINQRIFAQAILKARWLWTVMQRIDQHNNRTWVFHYDQICDDDFEGFQAEIIKMMIEAGIDTNHIKFYLEV